MINHHIQRIAAILAQAAIEISNRDEVINKLLETNELTTDDVSELKQALSHLAKRMEETAEMHEMCMAMEETTK